MLVNFLKKLHQKYWSDVELEFFVIFQEIYEQIDKNSDGTIEFEEFVTVLDH